MWYGHAGQHSHCSTLVLQSWGHVCEARAYYQLQVLASKSVVCCVGAESWLQGVCTTWSGMFQLGQARRAHIDQTLRTYLFTCSCVAETQKPEDLESCWHEWDAMTLNQRGHGGSAVGGFCSLCASLHPGSRTAQCLLLAVGSKYSPTKPRFAGFGQTMSMAVPCHRKLVAEAGDSNCSCFSAALPSAVAHKELRNASTLHRSSRRG